MPDAKGMAVEFVRRMFGGSTRAVENPVTNSVGVAGVLIARNNPERIELIVCNLSVNNIYMGLSPRVSSTNGILVSPNGGTVTLTVAEDGEATAYEWYAIASGAASAIYVLEVVRG